MLTSQLHASQSFRRARQYLTDHADAVPAANASEARSTLDAAIADIESASAAQGTGTREIRGEVRKRRQQEVRLVKKYMSPLSKLARSSLKGAPDYAALTPSAGALQRERLVLTARTMAAAAVKYSTEIEQAKFPPQFLEQLVAAAKKIQVAVASGRQAIAALDSLIGHLVIDDAVLLREWKSAKRLRQTSSAADPVASAPEVTVSVKIVVA